jgi:hypothetical protein
VSELILSAEHLWDLLNELGCERSEATHEVRQHIAALEQHVSDLEKSLEAARRGRDEAVSHLADVTEVLVGERPVGMMPGTTLEAAKALVRDRDAALADNAEMASLIPALSQCFAGGLNGKWTPDLARRTSNALTNPHPGAALLAEVTRLRIQVATGGEEWLEVQQALGFPDDGMIRSVLDVRDAVVGLLEQHRKALVRARNEGLEKAIGELRALGFHETPAGLGVIDRIRALKEPEQ